MLSYEKCNLCPNCCNVDRRVKRGACGEKAEVRVAWSGLHRGEEPPITGQKGSGMIFFSGCPLGCAYCQNRQISGRDSYGIAISTDELASLMLSLEEFGANTLNLVTGTHFIPSIIEALNKAKAKGFSLPVVWNSSGFESVAAIEAIDPYIDLYLLDIKTLSPIVAKEFCGGEKYVKAIKPLVEYLVKARPKTDLDALKGTLVRHLVFPGTLEATVAFLAWYGEKLKDHFMLSLMVQFVNPDPAGRKFEKIKEDEYDLLLGLLDEFEIDGFVQELGDEDCWIPDFTRDDPFPEPFADPLPYFLELKNSRS